MIEVKNIKAEEIRRKTVKPGGNSGQIYLPRAWVGREVIIILEKDQEMIDEEINQTVIDGVFEKALNELGINKRDGPLIKMEIPQFGASKYDVKQSLGEYELNVQFKDELDLNQTPNSAIVLLLHTENFPNFVTSFLTYFYVQRRDIDGVVLFHPSKGEFTVPTPRLNEIIKRREGLAPVLLIKKE